MNRRSSTKISNTIKSEKSITKTVVFVHSLVLSHSIRFNSINTLLIGLTIFCIRFFFFFMVAYFNKDSCNRLLDNWQAHLDSNQEQRFWRPLFYQLNYGPTFCHLIFTSLCIVCFLHLEQNFLSFIAAFVFLGFLVFV